MPPSIVYFIGLLVFGFIGWTYILVVKDELSKDKMNHLGDLVVSITFFWPLAVPLMILGVIAKGTAYYIRVKFMGKSK
jgi:hypothetical protein